VKVDWRFTNEVLAEVVNPLDDICKRGAELIRDDAIRNAPIGKWSAPGRSGGQVTSGTDHLADHIKVVRSDFTDGGWIAIAQGPDDYDVYYASFVEFGTPKTRPGYPEQPYMRPAIQRNRPRIFRMFENYLDSDVHL